MNKTDLKRAITDLGWKYTEAKIDLVFNELSDLMLEYEDILPVGINITNKPSPGKLIKAIKEIANSKCLNLNTLYEVININADDPYYRKALELTIKFAWINPMLLTGIDNIDRYLRNLQSVSSAVYEIAWIWLFFKDYQHNLPMPEIIKFPKIWEMYGIEY